MRRRRGFPIRWTIDGQSKPPAATPTFALQEAKFLGGTGEFRRDGFHVWFVGEDAGSGPEYLEIKYSKSDPIPDGFTGSVVSEWTFKIEGKPEKIVSAEVKAEYDAFAKCFRVKFADLVDAARKTITSNAIHHRGKFKEIEGALKLRIGDWPFQSVNGTATINLYEAPVIQQGEPVAQPEEASPLPPPAPVDGAMRLMPWDGVTNRLRL